MRSHRGSRFDRHLVPGMILRKILALVVLVAASAAWSAPLGTLSSAAAGEPIYDMLIRHEGVRLKPYRDILGKLIVGIGRNLNDVGISEDEAFILLDNDVTRTRRGLDKYLPWWSSQPEPAKLVLQNMAFQMGDKGLLRFRRFLAALQHHRCTDAAKEMLKSRWARQTPKRAQELAGIVAVKC